MCVSYKFKMDLAIKENYLEDASHGSSLDAGRKIREKGNDRYCFRKWKVQRRTQLAPGPQLYSVAAGSKSDLSRPLAQDLAPL